MTHQSILTLLHSHNTMMVTQLLLATYTRLPPTANFNTMMVTLLLLTAYTIAFAERCTAWIPPSSPPIRYDSSIQSKSSSTDRREFLSSSLIVGTTLLTTFNNAYPAFAGTSQVQKDKDNIVKGYNRLQYLLDNVSMKTLPFMNYIV